MEPILLGAIAVLAGALLGFWFGKSSSRSEPKILREQIDIMTVEKETQAAAAKQLQDQVTSLTGELKTAEANLAAEKAKYAAMEERLEKAFGDLAAKALSANNQSFLTLAQEKLGSQNADA